MKKKNMIIMVLASFFIILYVVLLVKISRSQNPYHVEFMTEKEEYVISEEEEQDIYYIPVTILNKANRELTSKKDFKLSYHLYDKEGRELSYDNIRTDLSQILSTDKKKVDMKVTVPKQKGIYLLRIDIVQENVIWFSETGNPCREVWLMNEKDGGALQGKEAL